MTKNKATTGSFVFLTKAAGALLLLPTVLIDFRKPDVGKFFKSRTASVEELAPWFDSSMCHNKTALARKATGNQFIKLTPLEKTRYARNRVRKRAGLQVNSGNEYKRLGRCNRCCTVEDSVKCHEGQWKKAAIDQEKQHELATISQTFRVIDFMQQRTRHSFPTPFSAAKNPFKETYNIAQIHLKHAKNCVEYSTFNKQRSETRL